MTRMFFVLLVVAVVGGCSEAKIGEACATAGAADLCEEGAICSADSAGTVCRKICTDQEDCTTGNCNGLPGSTTKSCQE